MDSWHSWPHIQFFILMLSSIFFLLKNYPMKLTIAPKITRGICWRFPWWLGLYMSEMRIRVLQCNTRREINITNEVVSNYHTPMTTNSSPQSCGSLQFSECFKTHFNYFYSAATTYEARAVPRDQEPLLIHLSVKDPNNWTAILQKKKNI